jgi:hypothetical protein
LAGEAPANLIGLLLRYFDLTPSTWGRDCYGGDYPWLERLPKPRQPSLVPRRASSPPPPGTSGAGLAGQPIPLYGFLQGDTIGLVIFGDTQETASSLAAKLEQAASVRVRPGTRAHGRSLRIRYKGRLLDPDQTLASAAIEPLDRFDGEVAEV